MTSIKTSASRTHRVFAFASILVSVLLVGCSTTTIKLSGTPGTSFSGHYVLGTTAHDLYGTTPVVLEVPGGALTECEVRKADPKAILTLSIHRGPRTKVKATAEPGALGIRVRDNKGWTAKVLR